MKLKTLLRSSNIKLITGAVFSIVCIAYLSVLIFPVRYWAHEGGLDKSPSYAVNYFPYTDIKYGRDIIWGYGPYSYLVLTMAIGSNLTQGILFQSAMHLLFLGLLTYAYLKRYIKPFNIFVFTLFMLVAKSLFQADGAQVDQYMVMIVMILIAIIRVRKRRSYFFLLLSVLISSFLVYIKFTTGIQALSIIAGFYVVKLYLERKQAIMETIIAAAMVIFFTIAFYMFHNFSITGYFTYLRDIIELSSGYSVVLGTTSQLFTMITAIVVVIAYLLLCFTLFKNKQRTFHLSLIFLLPILIVFKSACVMEGEHIIRHYTYVILTTSIVLLFSDFKKIVYSFISRFLITVSIIPMILFWFSSYLLIYGDSYRDMGSAISRFKHSLDPFNTYWEFKKTIMDHKWLDNELKKSADTNLAAYKLPDAWTKAIGDATVAIYPYQIVYHYNNSFQLRPFPVLQAYAAWTSYLDKRNKDFLEDDNIAPDYILYESTLVKIEVIKPHHTFIDSPSASVSMYKWYDYVDNQGDLLLLKRRSSPRFSSPHLLKETVYNLNDIVTIPESDHPLIAKIQLDYSLIGITKKVLIKLIAPQLRFQSKEQYRVTYAFSPQVIDQGIMVNCFPETTQDFIDLFAGSNQSVKLLDEFQLLLPEKYAYKHKFKVSFYEIKEMRVR